MNKQEIYKRIIKALKWLGGSVLSVGVAFIIFNPLIRKVQGPEDYYIQFVGNFADSSISNIRDKFKEVIDTKSLAIDNIQIKVNPKEWHDHGDPDDAESIAVKLAKDEKTLFIIGHFYSSTTKRALPVYMNSNPQIPVLLTTETHPYLVPTNDNAMKENPEYLPIYALSPDDFNQSQVAAEFAINNGCNRFWVIKDSENQVYSEFLATNFSRQVQEHKRKVMLISDTRFLPSIETIQKLNIDCIFFAGQWQNALITLNQVRAIFGDLEMPNIILSDGCVDMNLLEKGGDMVRNIFLTYPLSDEDYKNGNGFGKFGELAASEIEFIIDKANGEFHKNWVKSWLGINRVADARIAIKKAMEKNLESYRDDKAKFHIWEIRENVQEDNKLDFFEVDNE